MGVLLNEICKNYGNNCYFCICSSISEDNSQMLLSLKNEITDDTSENSILAQTNNDETLSAQKNSEILRANEGTYSDLHNDIFNMVET